MTRRKFGQAVSMTAASYGRVLGANDQVGLLVVGSGRRGREVARHLLASKRARLAGICDVYDVQRERAREAWKSHLDDGPRETASLEEALEFPGVDAVLIASPDHLHVGQATAALAGGKHVYLEKPTMHRWSERAALEQAAASAKGILQCGTQQRSGDHYARAKHEIFERKRLGELVFVRAVWHNFPWQQRQIPPSEKPPGLDWERFLGPAPRVPYESARYDAWRYFPEYGGGLLADILTHWVDVAQWLSGDAAPVDAVSTGGIYQLRDGRENPDTVQAILRYRTWQLSFESSVLSIRNDRPSVLFEGTEGLLEITRSGYVFTPNKGEPERVDASMGLDIAHTANFLDALTGRAKPSAGLRAGMEATLPVQMALKAYRTGLRVTVQDDL